MLIVHFSLFVSNEEGGLDRCGDLRIITRVLFLFLIPGLKCFSFVTSHNSLLFGLKSCDHP